MLFFLIKNVCGREADVQNLRYAIVYFWIAGWFRCLCVHSVVSYATLHCVGLERTVFYFMHLFRHTLPSSVGGCKSSNVCMYSIAQYSSLNKFEEL